MRIHRFHHPLRLGLIVLFLIIPAATAFALPPTVETQQVHVHLDNVGECDGFHVDLDLDVTRRITTFYDQEGTPIRRVVHAHGKGMVSNSVTGASAPAALVRNIIVDLETGTVASTATNVHVVLPGEGTLQLSAGRFELDADGNLIVEVGRQDPPITAELCEALS